MKNLKAKLAALITDDPFEADTMMMYELVEQMKAESMPFEFVEPILRFIESHPTVWFGAPGPLVHFMEKFYHHGYEALLCASFSRQPTKHTAMMLHRLINGSTGEEKARYVQLYAPALQRVDVDRFTREEIARFQALHVKEAQPAARANAAKRRGSS